MERNEIIKGIIDGKIELDSSCDRVERNIIKKLGGKKMERNEIIKGIIDGKIEIINCTPLQLVWHKGYEITTIEPSGTVARINIEEVELGYGFVTHTKGEVIDLHEPEEGKVFVVSGLVFAATDRVDVIAPNTNKSIRDENGKIIGVPGFIMH